jgi:L-rhamnose mutarotase
MQRKALQLRIRQERVADYDEAHRHVWPELIAELQAFGVQNYSIFRRGQELFLYLSVPDFAELLRNLEASEINRRWQKMLAPMFEPVPSLEPDESFAMMDEVFFIPSASEATERQAREKSDAK